MIPDCKNSEDVLHVCFQGVSCSVMILLYLLQKAFKQEAT